jgi:small subunit ribosomal protein S6
MNSNKRSYRATFILDNRGREESIEQLIEGVKKEIAAVDGEVTGVENIGKKDFVRITDKKLTGATYVQIAFAGAAETPSRLRERLRLNGTVYRTFIQNA